KKSALAIFRRISEHHRGFDLPLRNGPVRLQQRGLACWRHQCKAVAFVKAVVQSDKGMQHRSTKPMLVGTWAAATWAPCRAWPRHGLSSASTSANGLNALDPNRPIREADMQRNDTSKC